MDPPASEPIASEEPARFSSTELQPPVATPPTLPPPSMKEETVEAPQKCAASAFLAHHPDFHNKTNVVEPDSLSTPHGPTICSSHGHEDPPGRHVAKLRAPQWDEEDYQAKHGLSSSRPVRSAKKTSPPTAATSFNPPTKHPLGQAFPIEKFAERPRASAVRTQSRNDAAEEAVVASVPPRAGAATSQDHSQVDGDKEATVSAPGASASEMALIEASLVSDRGNRSKECIPEAEVVTMDQPKDSFIDQCLPRTPETRRLCGWILVALVVVVIVVSIAVVLLSSGSSQSEPQINSAPIHSTEQPSSAPTDTDASHSMSGRAQIPAMLASSDKPTQPPTRAPTDKPNPVPTPRPTPIPSAASTERPTP